MSFKRVSAILRSTWLVDKQWANAHMPLVYSFLKGDTNAASNIMGMDWDDDDDDDLDDDKQMQLAKNVYEITPNCDLSKLPDGSIAYVDIDGPLFKAGDICSYGMEDFSEFFYALADAPNILGVILDLDSPGGQVDGAATFADAVKQCAAQKPVIGFVDDGMACSAAYWVLSACTEIYCSQPTDVTGSIGVYCTIADWNAYYASLGLPVQDIYAPQSTEKNIEYRDAIGGDDSKMKADLKFIADTFISTVKANRKVKIVGNNWATGATYFAADALQQGLIDGIKSFDQVVFRTNRLINQNKNSNMAFEKTLAAAKAESFAVVDEGFALSEEQMNALEAHLIASENADGEAARLKTDNDALTATGEELATTILNNATTISTQATRISELEALVAKYGGQASGNGSSVTPTPAAETSSADENAGKFKSALDDPDHPLNKMADGLVSGPKRSIE